MAFTKLGLGAVLCWVHRDAYVRPRWSWRSRRARSKVVTWSLAIWTTFTFMLCVVYGLLTPSGVHMTAFLEQALPGFEWLSWRGFLAGLIQSFLYGAYAGLVYVPIYNFLHRKWVTQ